MKSNVFVTGFFAVLSVLLTACSGTHTGGEETPDACVPGCSGRQCGQDGCGGVCGECAADEVCTDAGQCSATCERACEGRECGPDGCDGVCAECAADEICTDAGQCTAACERACSGRECGVDGCGGVCGECAPDEVCSADGVCEPSCSPDCDGRECGLDGCGGGCGTCGADLTCDASGKCVCVPSCDGRECGDDGCGGSCGSCPTNHECDASGACVGIQVSINCPAGQVCMIYQYSAHEYSCNPAPGGGMECTVTGTIATFPNTWSCRNACRDGALKCAKDESKPTTDPVVSACLACLESCREGTPLQCPEETAGGCLWNGQLVYDGETVVCDCT